MKPTVLVLDDQILYLRSMARALRPEYEVIVVSSVDEAWKQLGPDVAVVLADVRLREDCPEDRQGLMFIRWLKENRPGIPGVLMSALDDPALPELAKAAGAACFLHKPIRVSELRRVLASALTKAHEQAQSSTP